MPRAIDPSLPAGGLPITHSPLNTIRYNVVPNPADLAELLQMIADGFVDSVRDYIFPAIEELTGIDLSVLLPLLDVLDLDFSTPAAFLTSLVQAILALPAALAQVVVGVVNELTGPGGTEQLTALIGAIITLLVTLPSLVVQLAKSILSAGVGLNSLDLFNIVPTNVLGQLNFSNIGETFANLITDPDFLDPTPIPGWLHDLTGGFGGTGSRTVTADGTVQELLSNLIPVSVGQVMPLAVKAKWADLVGIGNPIALAVTGYNDSGDAVDQQTVADHSTIPATTDWRDLTGAYTVPAGVTGVRTRLSVLNTATAGTVSFSKSSASKSQTLFQRLIAGTDPGQILSDDIGNLFTGIVTNALALLTKTPLGDFEDLVAGIGGPVGEGIEDAITRVNTFLHSLSPLNGSNIASGSIGDSFIPGIGSLHDTVVTAVGNLGGSGFDITKVFEVLTGQTYALVDHGAGISDMYARMSNLESQFAALPVSAGGTGSGNADGGLVGAIDTDTFERVNTSSIAPLWLQSYSGGAGTWEIPNGHDATWDSSGNDTREFLCIRDNPAIPRSQTDYQRVTMELSSKATRDRDLLGLYDFCGTNDIWLRISDDTTSLANVTAIRIRWEGDGALSIHRFVSGAGVQLAGLGTGGITPPGPGAQLIGEAGALEDGAPRYFRARIGDSIRLAVQEVGTASGLGAAYRRWGHGGRAQGASLFVGQTKPGGVHFWNGMDQTTT